MKKFRPVYAFEEADFKNRMLLGGKGAGLSNIVSDPEGALGSGTTGTTGTG